MNSNPSLQCWHCCQPLELETVSCYYQYEAVVYCHKCWLSSGAAELAAYDKVNEHIRQAEQNQKVYEGPPEEA